MSATNNVTKTSQGSTDGKATDAPQHALSPAVDIVESEMGITLLADMPGVSKERLTVRVEGDNLTIEGRALIDVPENIELLHSEVRTPNFRRTFTLSRDLDPEKIVATLRNGVLQLRIPKSEQARPKRIEVQVG